MLSHGSRGGMLVRASILALTYVRENEELPMRVHCVHGLTQVKCARKGGSLNSFSTKHHVIMRFAQTRTTSIFSSNSQQAGPTEPCINILPRAKALR